MSQDERDREGCARCWTLIKRAVLTHDAMPGEKLSQLVTGIDVIREAEEAYGYTEEAPARFIPKPRDVSNLLPVLAWLCWIRSDPGSGSRDFKILIGRARGFSWWKLAQRFGRSERQVMRWLDGAIAAIYARHMDEVWKLEPGK